MRQIVLAFGLSMSLAGCVGVAQPYPGPAGAASTGTQVAMGGRCFAGIYTCPIDRAQPVGSPCSCPGLGAPSFGNVR